MALRDQPYLPLYVQDFLTDEKLSECSAKATGVYIRLMCLMHKSETYGRILLKQKDKQSEKQIENFAFKLVKQMPYSLPEVLEGLTELVEENVLSLEGDFLIQKRMVEDAQLSEKRSLSGKKGGLKTVENKQFFALDFAKAKSEANTENEIENEIESVNENKTETINQRRENFSKKVHEYTEFTEPMRQKFFEYWSESNENGRKMRFEMQKVFDIKRRLNTWKTNEFKFKNNNNAKNQSTSIIERKDFGSDGRL